MQGSQAWREKRLNEFYISGTTVQSICNEHPFKNSDDIFNELGGIIPHFTGNAASRLGQAMESVIIKRYEEIKGVSVVVDLPFQPHPTEAHVGVSPDGLTLVPLRPVEIKFAAVRKIKPGVVPVYYSGQLQLTMAVFGVDEMDFVQMDSSGFVDIIPVYRDPTYFIDRIPLIRDFVARVEHYRTTNVTWLDDYNKWDM